MLLHSAATLVAAVMVACGATVLFNTTGDRLQRQVLDEYADSVQAGLRRRDQRWNIDAAVASVLRGAGSSFSFWIDEQDGRIAVDNARFTPSLPVPRQRRRVYFKRVYGSKIYSGVSIPLRARPESWLVIVQNLDHPTVIFDDLRAQVAIIGAGLLGLFFIGLLGVDAVIVRRTLAPVRQASKEVERISPNELQQRVNVRGMPVEILPLLQAFNCALDRVEHAYRIERDFAADAAHELRTPLAILRLLLEQGALHHDMARTLRQIDRVDGIVERLLFVAEVDAMTWSEEEAIDLRELAEDRVASIVPLLLAKGQEIEVAGPSHVAAFSSQHLAGRALDALLENAMKHTPSGTKIKVTVSANAAICVADNGPGVSLDANIFTRFSAVRRDLARSSGLGLAIANELMGKVGGSLEAAQSSSRGAMFTLRFKPARKVARD